ncbi:hypothetical protein DPMN_035128 [Dreissena polymorpha]|uniref:Uncharacterized protein n=1 Tax=Dreissena polymorpha TaxID=45954 RepID=A0A9D4M845_DREPO|nr:hypothetical protein DPMN_035128 [Dreissena polymorpha]
MIKNDTRYDDKFWCDNRNEATRRLEYHPSRILPAHWVIKSIHPILVTRSASSHPRNRLLDLKWLEPIHPIQSPQELASSHPRLTCGAITAVIVADDDQLPS